jgi:agmatine deiminase
MKIFFMLFLTALILVSCSVAPKKETHIITRQAAEFEPLDAIWLIWPNIDHKEGESVQDVTILIIAALINDINVVISCRDKALLNESKKLLNNHFPNSKHLNVIELPSFDIWVRDMGQIFVETNQNTLAIADFNFDSWGYSDTLDADTKLDEMYDVRVAELLDLPVI